MTTGFSDPVVAQQTRDVLQRLVVNVLDQERPSYQYAEVVSIDIAAGTCTVIFTGDTTPVTVSFGSVRPAQVGQIVRVEGNRGDRYIADVIGATGTGGAIIADGSAPASSPKPVLTPGLGFILAQWSPVINADPVTYEVHVSTVSGFTPSAATKVGENTGTFYFIRALPDAEGGGWPGFPEGFGGSNPALDYNTIYFVRLIAKDIDGAAPVGAQSFASPVSLSNSDIGGITLDDISDGVAPVSSPTPVVTNGIGFLYVTWTPLVNVDPVTYDIHISTTSGFTPNSNTLVGSTTATFAFIRRQGPGGTPANGDLVYGVVYFVKLIARDADGQAPASGQDDGTSVQALETDIGPNSISTGHIQVGSITAASGIIADAAIGTAKIQDAAIVTAKIGDAQITTAKIGDLQVVSAKIASLVVDKLTSGSLSAADITLAGGSLRAGTPPTTGLLMDEDGLSLYSGGVRTVFLDAAIGAGTFTGTITGSLITGSTFKTNGAANTERVEILTAPETIDGITSNFVKMYSPVPSTGVDPYRPGRLFSDVVAVSGVDIGMTYLRPPYAASTSGQPYLGLESGRSTDGTLGKVILGFFQPSTGIGPQLEMLFGQSTLYDSNLTVFGNIVAGSGFAVRATVLEGASAGSAAQTRMHSSNKFSTLWDGQLHFYVDDSYVGTLP